MFEDSSNITLLSIYFHLPKVSKDRNFDTVQVHDLLSGESSVMFEETSNIWGMFFEQYVLVAKVLGIKTNFEYKNTIRSMV